KCTTSQISGWILRRRAFLRGSASERLLRGLALQSEQLLDRGGELLVLRRELRQVTGLQSSLAGRERVLGIRQGLRHRIRRRRRGRALIRRGVALIRRGGARIGGCHSLITADRAGVAAEQCVQRLRERVLERDPVTEGDEDLAQ